MELHRLHKLELFTTERRIRARSVGEFLRRAEVYKKQADEAKEKGVQLAPKESYQPELAKNPAYEKWVQDRIADARKDGRLVTEQQYQDLHRGRVLMLNDRVRYIGPTEMEPTDSGRPYLRKTGEQGRIIEAVKNHQGLFSYVFMPDVPEEAMSKDGPDVFVATRRFLQSTEGYFKFERITTG